MPSETARPLVDDSSEYGSLDHGVFRDMEAMGQRARSAARVLAAAKTARKNDAFTQGGSIFA